MNEETLFHAALARPSPLERAAFLDGACAGKPELRATIEALLVAHTASGGFLDNSPVEPRKSVDSAASEQGSAATGEFTTSPSPSRDTITMEYCGKLEVGAVIAERYMLQEKIGEGGMGEVWVAKQSEPIKRKVALKLIKPGMDSRAVLQRFEQERQALAMMDHPNIAKVFDAGMTPNGQPFFVMELVNGLPLSKFCDEARLTPTERLELFVPICQAVQHAHQKGIVHRDLKPANILVTMIDGKPVPKVIDFGVAKATAGKLTDESLSTQFGAVIGTLEYMSPEQAGSSGEDVDTRADIYSLGVILYELLTGLRPIDAKRLKKAALTEIIQIIRAEEPSRPSIRLLTDESLPSLAALRQTEPRKLMSMLRGELDWVVMKCLEKHRDRRYETANGLARDIQRYLASEPVEARPPSAGYRLKKFVRRHKGQVIAASFVLLALVAGIIGTTWGLFRADRARRAEAGQRKVAVEEKKKAETSEALANKQRTRAEDREQQAIDAVKRFRDAVADNRALKYNPTLKSLRNTLLKEPLAFFQSLRDRLQADGDTRPEALARLAEVIHDYSHLTDEIGDKRDGLEAHDQSLAIWEGLVRQVPDNPEYQHGLSMIQNCRGNFLHAIGRTADALASYTRALEIQERLARQSPAITEFQRDLAITHYNTGTHQSDTDRPADALSSYTRALEIFERLARENPTETRFQSELAASHNGRGVIQVATGRTDDALASFTRAAEIGERLARENPAVTQLQRDLAMSHHNVSSLHYNAGRLAEALASTTRALEIEERLARENPAITKFQSELSRSIEDMGVLQRAAGRPAEALASLTRALAIRERLAREHPESPDYASVLGGTLNNIAMIDIDAKRFDAARDRIEQAIVWQGKALAADPKNPTYRQFLLNHQVNLNKACAGLIASGKSAEAMKAFETAVAIRRKLAVEHAESPDFASELAGLLQHVGVIDFNAKRFDVARERIRQAIEWQRKALAADPKSPKFRQYLANQLGCLTETAKRLGRNDEVAEAQRELRELQATDPGFAAMDARLAALIGGEAPKDNAERLALAQRAYDTSRYAAAAKLWAEALEADPRLAADRKAGHRYNAACAASLATSGAGKDDSPPDDAAKAKLRRQALDWLNAELSAWKRVSMAVQPGNEETVASTLAHWKHDADLASIRDEKELAKLPDEERASFMQLWNAVDELLTKVGDRK